LFISYEDFHHRMTVVDDLSPLFIAIFAGCFAVDVLLFRYRRKKMEQELEKKTEQETEQE
jgi:TctA family transporter